MVNFGTQLMENSNLGNKLLKPREIMGSRSDVGFGSVLKRSGKMSRRKLKVFQRRKVKRKEGWIWWLPTK